MIINHSFVSSVAEGSDPTKVRTSNWNEEHELSGGVEVFSEDYKFEALIPGGSLTSGITNTVTLIPVPEGVNGTDVGHSLYISGGTGTAEAVLITGGTATSGSASGTISFIPANNHGGAWTIESATAGMQEAINLLPSGGKVKLPNVGITVYATTRVNVNSVVIQGAGKGATIVTTSGFTTQDVFLFDGASTCQFNAIMDLRIDSPSDHSHTDGYGIKVLQQNLFLARNLYINYCPNGIYMEDTNQGHIDTANLMEIYPATGQGIVIIGTNNYALLVNRVIVNSGTAGYAGIRITQCQDVLITNSHFLTVQFGLLVDPTSGKTVTSLESIGCYYDNCTNTGAYIVPASGAYVVRCRFTHCWFSSASQNGFYIIQGAGSSIDGVLITACQFFLNGTYGLLVEGATNVRVMNNIFSQNSNASSGVYAGALFVTSNFSFIGNTSGQSDGLGNTQSYGVQVFPGVYNNYLIQHNNLINNVSSALNDGGTGTTKIVKDNLGVTALTTASTGNVPLGTTGANQIFLTGTIPVNNFTPVYDGLEIQVIFTNAAPGGITAAGNIATAISATQNVPIWLKYNATAVKFYGS